MDRIYNLLNNAAVGSDHNAHSWDVWKGLVVNKFEALSWHFELLSHTMGKHSHARGSLGQELYASCSECIAGQLDFIMQYHRHGKSTQNINILPCYLSTVVWVGLHFSMTEDKKWQIYHMLNLYWSCFVWPMGLIICIWSTRHVIRIFKAPVIFNAYDTVFCSFVGTVIKCWRVWYHVTSSPLLFRLKNLTLIHRTLDLIPVWHSYVF